MGGMLFSATWVESSLTVFYICRPFFIIWFHPAQINSRQSPPNECYPFCKGVVLWHIFSNWKTPIRKLPSDKCDTQRRSSYHISWISVSSALTPWSTMGFATPVLKSSWSTRLSYETSRTNLAAKERQMDLVEVLGFIFMLSTMELSEVLQSFST